MRTFFLIASLFVGGAYAGACIVDQVGYAKGFEAGYSDGLKSANSVIEGISK